MTKRRGIGDGLYQDERGRIYIRPWVEGRRTWKKMSALAPRRASEALAASETPSEQTERFREHWSQWLNRVPPPPSVPKCLEEFNDRLGHMILPPVRVPGIYFLMDGPSCVYVGKSTTHMAKRIVKHLLDKVFDRVIVLPSPPEEVHHLERYFILVLSPRYNKAGVFRGNPKNETSDVVD